MRIRDVSQPPVSFQLAPMIDIVFLLLIFFLVTYQITEQEKDSQVAVPTSTEGSQVARVANEIIINITQEGGITISGETYTKEELRAKLERIVAAAETAGQGSADQQPVRLRGDAETSWQTMTEVMDEVLKAGIWNIRFASRDAPKQ
ncbi:biopolymer transporter ExbD [Akkermansiaceae bacterium]|nr:biopolymer transporter ExbD [Akkermansiaceae bacterium]MDB4310865.1 biopolymer transporter ExbD [bacterium]MDB0068389.1 biopolymer transporter ExbD [Akkermansiaceae bacterium]MDB4041769.1 biopolymer transporter ExbD [Akkermansiaceae bacterium]MDB4143618.1 biopolymer transporter ExbD [Akkermansiaceae bacterium]